MRGGLGWGGVVWAGMGLRGAGKILTKQSQGLFRAKSSQDWRPRKLWSQRKFRPSQAKQWGHLEPSQAQCTGKGAGDKKLNMTLWRRRRRGKFLSSQAKFGAEGAREKMNMWRQRHRRKFSPSQAKPRAPLEPSQVWCRRRRRKKMNM